MTDTNPTDAAQAADTTSAPAAEATPAPAAPEAHVPGANAATPTAAEVLAEAQERIKAFLPGTAAPATINAPAGVAGIDANVLSPDKPISNDFRAVGPGAEPTKTFEAKDIAPGTTTVEMDFPREVWLTLESHNVVHFRAGRQSVPAELAAHPWLAARGAKPVPEPETYNLPPDQVGNAPKTAQPR